MSSSPVDAAATASTSTGGQTRSRRARNNLINAGSAARYGTNTTIPVGDIASDALAITSPAASGSTRLVAMPRSTRITTASSPTATHGSERSPVLNGNHHARNAAAASHGVDRSRATLPSLGSSSLDSSN